MTIHSYNEWDTVREIVVGSATNANWPTHDAVFSQEAKKTTWQESPPPQGPVPDWIVEESNEDLAGLCDILTDFGALVHRPLHMDFVDLDGMYNYCPRDRLLVAGQTLLDPVMMYPCRDMELTTFSKIVDVDAAIRMPRDQGMIMDAANVCRCNDHWVFLESASGNRAAYDWLCQQFPDIKIELANFYAGVHIDSTIVPLRDGLVMLNASRVSPDTVPHTFRGWEVIWIEDVAPQDFYKYPYASKWIAMNVLSLDSRTVVVDRAQDDLRKQLEARGFTVIPHQLRHSRTLGGGFHCVTLDLWRSHD